MSYFNEDDLERLLREFAEWLMEMESKGYIERVGTEIDEFGFPEYRMTKKGINKVFDFQLRFTGRKN
jgi:hypothetical protein